MFFFFFGSNSHIRLNDRDFAVILDPINLDLAVIIGQKNFSLAVTAYLSVLDLDVMPVLSDT